MAKQNGPIQLQGTIGQITFFKNRDGSYGAKAKGGITKERFLKDPNFILARQNGAEFASAGKSGRTLRGAFQELLIHADDKMVPRLHKVLMKCLQADSTNDNGSRTVATGNPLLLEEFDFNAKSPVTATFKAPYTTTITRSSGTVAISIPSFVPTVLLGIPQGATHFKVVAGASAVDFALNKHSGHTAASTAQTADATPSTAINLSMTVPSATTDPIFVVLGVLFYKEVNGSLSAMNNNAFNALSIIKVDV